MKNKKKRGKERKGGKGEEERERSMPAWFSYPSSFLVSFLSAGSLKGKRKRGRKKGKREGGSASFCRHAVPLRLSSGHDWGGIKGKKRGREVHRIRPLPCPGPFPLERPRNQGKKKKRKGRECGHPAPVRPGHISIRSWRPWGGKKKKNRRKKGKRGEGKEGSGRPSKILFHLSSPEKRKKKRGRDIKKEGGKKKERGGRGDPCPCLSIQVPQYGR